jgi:hypothetical protein
MEFVNSQQIMPWPYTGYGSLPLTVEEAATVEVAFNNYLIELLNQIGNLNYEYDGTWDADKASHLYALIEAKLPMGTKLETATFEQIATILGADPETIGMIQSRLHATPAKTPWWHWGLAIGGGVVAGAAIVGTIWAIKR